MVTTAFLFEFVVPNMNVFFSNDDATNKVASVLALPLLFAAFEPNVWQSAMSREVRDRIVEGYKVLRGDAFEDGYNPVKKVSLVIHQIKNSLAIDELVVNVGEDGVETPTATAGTSTDFDRRYKEVRRRGEKRIFCDRVLVFSLLVILPCVRLLFLL